MILELKDQVISLESAKRLKELGCPQESLFYWMINKGNPNDSKYMFYKETQSYKRYKKIKSQGCIEYISTYTASELGELLPTMIRINGIKHILMIGKGFNPNCWKVSYRGGPNHKIIIDSVNEAEARAKMLIHLKEEGVVK